MITAAKFIGAGVAVVLLGWAGVCAHNRFVRKDMQHTDKLAALGKAVMRMDGVFVTDTLKLRRAIAITDTIRRNLVLTDTVRVRRVLTQDSVTIRACVETVSSCAAAIKARDNEIAELRKAPPNPRFSYPTEVLYDPLARAALVRGGAEVRMFKGFSLTAEGEFHETHGLAFRVGLRKVF